MKFTEFNLNKQEVIVDMVFLLSLVPTVSRSISSGSRVSFDGNSIASPCEESEYTDREVFFLFCFVCVFEIFLQC